MNTYKLYPSDVIDAVKTEQQRNPNDKNGYGAFKLDFAKEFRSDRNARYIPFSINIPNKGWIPVNLKILSLRQTGKIFPLLEGEKPRASSEVQSVSVRFRGDQTYERMFNGKKISEPYGEAKRLICKAFMAHVTRWQKNKKFSMKDRIIPNVRTERENKDTHEIEEIDPADINVTIRFAKGTSADDQAKPETEFRCPILDVTRKRENRRPGQWAHDDAKVTDINGDLVPVNNGNIHKFLTYGSIISGIEAMRYVCANASKISLPSSFDVCMVKPAKFTITSPNDFDDQDMDMIEGGGEQQEAESTFTNEKPAEPVESAKPVESNSTKSAIDEVTQQMAISITDGDDYDFAGADAF